MKKKIILLMSLVMILGCFNYEKEIKLEGQNDSISTTRALNNKKQDNFCFVITKKTEPRFGLVGITYKLTVNSDKIKTINIYNLVSNEPKYGIVLRKAITKVEKEMVGNIVIVKDRPVKIETLNFNNELLEEKIIETK